MATVVDRAFLWVCSHYTHLPELPVNEDCLSSHSHLYTERLSQCFLLLPACISERADLNVLKD